METAYHFDEYIVQLNSQRLKSYCELFLLLFFSKKKTHTTHQTLPSLPIFSKLISLLLSKFSHHFPYLFFRFIIDQLAHHILPNKKENTETTKRSSLTFSPFFSSSSFFDFIFFFDYFPLGKSLVD